MNEHEIQTLQARLQQFADELTPEEQAQLRATQTDDVAGMLSSSLWDKAQQVVDELTPEEQDQLRLLLEDAGVAAATGDDTDTRGFRMAEYEDEFGFKGPPGTSPSLQPQGGGSFTTAALGLLLFATTVMGPAVLISDPSLGTRP